ncbi:MAG: DUF6444 domain-containing protein [Actinomycetota bacterium]|nr:DUF6444 domain-containing protein [Actinomycetota bacterium]
MRDTRIAELEAANALLTARLADLEEQVGRTPRNSSMPPSQEGFSKPPAPNRAERRATKRRPGKQPGAEGKHLAQVDDPDEVIPHVPGVCLDCGGDLATAEVVDVERRQVFELLPIRLFVIEHRMERRPPPPPLYRSPASATATRRRPTISWNVSTPTGPRCCASPVTSAPAGTTTLALQLQYSLRVLLLGQHDGDPSSSVAWRFRDWRGHHRQWWIPVEERYRLRSAARILLIADRDFS